MKQSRVKFVDAEQENRDQNVPAQKTQSFKAEKKPESWFRRQFQHKTSRDYDSTEIEHAAAVAAVAYAVTLQEVSEKPQKKKVLEAPETSLTRAKSKADGSKLPISQTGGGTRPYSGEDSLKSTEVHGDNIPITFDTDEKKPEKTITPAPSVKKTVSFRAHVKKIGDKSPEIAEITDPEFQTPVDLGLLEPRPRPPPAATSRSTTERQTSRKPETFKPPPPRPPPSPPPPPPPPPAQTRTLRRPAAEKTKADIWLKGELERIEDRYEKLHETITSWENKKKWKARKKLDEHQGEPEKRRRKALQKHNEEIQYIDQIAEEARAQAKERQRREVLKAREKADSIRKTGKLPPTCFCF